MYGNLTKHRILKVISDYLVTNRLLAEYSFDYLKLKEMCNVETYKFGRYMTNMQTEGLITISNLGNDTAFVSITKKGASASTSDYFKRENDRVFWIRFRDVAMVLANLSVAIIAYYALNKDSKKSSQEIESLQSRLSKLELSAPTKKLTKDTVLYLKIDLSDSSKIKK